MQDLDLAQGAVGTVQLDRRIVRRDDARLVGRPRVDQLQQIPLHVLQQVVAGRSHEAVPVDAAQLQQLVEEHLPRVAQGGQQGISQVQQARGVR